MAEFADDMVISYGPMQWLFSHILEGFIPTLQAAKPCERFLVQHFDSFPSEKIRPIHRNYWASLRNNSFAVSRVGSASSPT